MPATCAATPAACTACRMQCAVLQMHESQATHPPWNCIQLLACTLQFLSLRRLGLLRRPPEGASPALDLSYLIDHVMHSVHPLDWDAVLASPLPLKVWVVCRTGWGVGGMMRRTSAA